MLTMPFGSMVVAPIKGLPNLVNETDPSWAFSNGLLGNKGFRAKFPATMGFSFITGVIVAVGFTFNFSLLNLEFGSAGVKVTEGAISLLLLLFDEIFSNEIEGLVETFVNFGFPVAGVKVQEPVTEIRKNIEKSSKLLSV